MLFTLVAVLGCSEKLQINKVSEASVDSEVKSKMSLVLICVATEKLASGKTDMEAIAALKEAKDTYLRKNPNGVSLTEKNISIINKHGVEGLLYINRKALIQYLNFIDARYDRIRNQELKASAARLLGKRYSGNIEPSAGCDSVVHIGGRIQRKIVRYWHSPLTGDRNKNAKIRIHLDYSGSVRNLDIVESSQDDVFDSSVVNAVQRASPFLVVKNIDSETFEECLSSLVLSFKRPKNEPYKRL